MSLSTEIARLTEHVKLSLEAMERFSAFGTQKCVKDKFGVGGHRLEGVVGKRGAA